MRCGCVKFLTLNPQEYKLPIIQCGRDVSEQVLECGNQVGGFSDIEIECFRAVLVEDGALGCLKEDIVKRVPCFPFLLDCFEEVVIYIFCFPIGERELVFVEDCTVNDDTVPFAARIGYCGMNVPFICFVQVSSRKAKGLLTAPSCLIVWCSYC